MNDMKKSYKLVTYSLQFKGYVIFAIAFFVAGTIFELTGDGSKMNTLTGLYYGISGSAIINQFMLTQVPGLMKSSRLSYYASTKAVTLGLLVYSLVAFTILAVLRLNISIPVALQRAENGEYLYSFRLLPETLYFDLIKSAFFIAFLFVYSAVSFRRYWPSLWIMVGAVVIFIGLGMSRVSFLENFEKSVIGNMMSFAGDMFVPMLLGICYAILLLGILVFRLLNEAMFKYEIEEIAYKNALRTALGK